MPRPKRADSNAEWLPRCCVQRISLNSPPSPKERGLHRRVGSGWHSDLHDERRCWMDNVFVERLWQSPRYEDICMMFYADSREARQGSQAPTLVCITIQAAVAGLFL